METVLGLLCGIGLAAACGFRVFLPLLGVSLAAASGHLTLAPGFDWMTSPVAITAFGVATVLEIAAYYVPWLDNLLDTIATPAAVIAGTMLTAAMVGDMSPFLKWTLALIAGGGTAALVQSGTVLLRGASTASTGGLANGAVATGELAGSAVTTTLAMIAPPLAVLMIAIAAAAIIRRRWPRAQVHPPPVPS